MQEYLVNQNIKETQLLKTILKVNYQSKNINKAFRNNFKE